MKYSGFRQAALMTEDEFIHALKIHLLCPLNPSNTNSRWLCQCSTVNEQVDILKNPYHFFSCKRNMKLIDQRHDLVRNALSDFCKTVGASPDQSEPPIIRTERNAPGTNRRADVVFFRSNGGKQFVFDVAVVDVCALSYLNGKGISEAIEKKTAAKESLYKDLDPGISFIPVILSTGGEVGKLTLSRLNDLGKYCFKSFYKTQAYADFNSILATYGARLLRNCLASVAIRDD